MAKTLKEITGMKHTTFQSSTNAMVEVIALSMIAKKCVNLFTLTLIFILVKKKEKKKHIINTSVNFTGQKLEKLETRKLENDFRVREVQKT